MKGNAILMILAVAIAIGGGIFMNQSFADETYSFSGLQAPKACVCSAPADLRTKANHFNRFQSGIKANLEPTFLMTLYNCQCGPLTCAVTTQAVSCIK